MRGEIGAASRASMARLGFVASNTDVQFRSMLTVTYAAALAPILDGAKVKSDLKNLLNFLRRHSGAKNGIFTNADGSAGDVAPGRFEYLWFLEFTRRGLPHVHLLMEREVPRPVERMGGALQNEAATLLLCSVWASAAGRDPRADPEAIERMRRVCARWEVVEKEDGARRYVNKYAYKLEQKTVPRGFRKLGRLWGNSKGVAPVRRESMTVQDWQLAGVPASEFTGQPYRIQFNGAASLSAILEDCRCRSHYLKGLERERARMHIGLLPALGGSGRSRREGRCSQGQCRSLQLTLPLGATSRAGG